MNKIVYAIIIIIIIIKNLVSVPEGFLSLQRLHEGEEEPFGAEKGLELEHGGVQVSLLAGHPV